MRHRGFRERQASAFGTQLPSLHELLTASNERSWLSLAVKVDSRLSSLRKVHALRRLASSGHLTVGLHSYGLPTILISHGEGSVSIGNFVSIGPEVMIIPSGEHRVEGPSTFPFGPRFGFERWDSQAPRKGRIVISHDAWLGTRAQVLSGVTVATGTVVAAGAVVTRDTEPYSIVAGVPARVVGYRIPQEQIPEMLETGWWSWSLNEILACPALVDGGSVTEFLQYVRDRGAASSFANDG